MKDIRTANPYEETYVRNAVEWNRCNGQSYGGFFYDEELNGPDGMAVQIFVPKGTPDSAIHEAEREARATQDVVAFGVLEVPAEWLDERTEDHTHVLGTLRKIVAEHTAGRLRWRNGDSQSIDVVTASMLCQVIDKVGDDTRKKMLRKMESSKAEFLLMLDIAWTSIN